MTYRNKYLNKNGSHRKFLPTQKRVQALAFVAAGWELKEISQHLGISETAVRMRLKYMRLVYKAPNRASLVTRAIESGALKMTEIAAIPQRFSLETDEEIHRMVGR